MINSRQKGKRFELKLAHILQEAGFDARRGQQYCGANGDADVIGLPGFHIEAKAVEALNIYKALEQAQNDARDGETPIVIHKKNRQEILATLKLDDFIKLYKGEIGGIYKKN